jgi:hypothetical protein
MINFIVTVGTWALVATVFVGLIVAVWKAFTG